jgi:multiple sugar transport system substrate-binding protein
MKGSHLKTAALTVLMVVIAVAAFAGGTNESVAGAKPASITVAVQAGAPEPAAYKPFAADWEKTSGIKIEWIDLPQESQHDKLVTELSNGTGTYDVIALDYPWVAEFAAAGYLSPLDDYLSKEKREDFFANYLKIESYKGKLYAIPQYMFAPIMFYRTDLFDKYGIRKPTLDNPLTKEEFLAACQKVMAGEGEGFYGTIVEAKRHPVPPTHFAEYIYREGGVIVDENNVPHVNEAPAVRALQFMSDLVNTYKVAPPGALGFDHVDNHTLFIQGKLLMVINWPYAFSMASDPAQSRVSDKFAVTIPWKAVRSTSITGGWGMALAKDSKKKQAAWDFISFITGTAQQYKLRKISFQAPTSRSEMEMLQKDTSFTKLQRDSLGAMTRAVENGSFLPNIPQWSQIQDRLNVAIQEAIGKQKTPQQALDDAQADIKKILGK